MATGGAYGGYDYNFVDGDPPSKYICTICTLVARDPQQVTCCYNTFCKSCLEHLKQSSKKQAQCPLCKEPLNFFKDGKINREIISLKVYCTNSEEGCEWKGTINETDTSIEAHLNDSCPYHMIPCTNECGENIRRSTLETHLTVNCPKRLVKCEYCQEKLPYCQIKSDRHLNKCPDYPVKCSNEECEEVIPRLLLASHNETCPKAIITCEYNAIGCEVKMKREEQEGHEGEYVRQHLQMTKKCLQEATDAIKSMKMALELRNALITSNEVFKLNQYARKKEENEGWYSPGFYTSPVGYKMELHVYPNGDSTHVSCFICLMPGEYDDTLEWPFQGEVNIKLLNQLEDKNHTKMTLKYNESTPDANKQRVMKGAMSQGWGTPRFIKHSELEYNPTTNCQYLKDDSLYFRVRVKVISKTKPWLAGVNRTIAID